MFPVVYDYATKVGTGPTPGAKALMAWALAQSSSATNAGIFNPRNVRGGTALSVHAEGRAIDVGFPPSDPGHPDGWRLAHTCVTHSAALGVQCVIYARRIWSVRYPSWRDYLGSDPHTGHVHIELNRLAAAELTRDLIEQTMEGAPLADVLTLPASRRASLIEIQQVLRDAGFYSGDLDADPGPATLAAVHALKNHARAVELELQQAGPAVDYRNLCAELVAVLDRYAPRAA